MMTITGKQVIDIEPNLAIKTVLANPGSLIQFILEHIAFETNIEDKIIISDKKPEGQDKRKIWFKSSIPYGIGYLIDGQWKMDFGVNGYPVNTPFLHKKINVPMEGLRELGDSDLTDIGINNTNQEAPNRYFWYIFEPTVD